MSAQRKVVLIPFTAVKYVLSAGVWCFGGWMFMIGCITEGMKHGQLDWTDLAFNALTCAAVGAMVGWLMWTRVRDRVYDSRGDRRGDGDPRT